MDSGSHRCIERWRSGCHHPSTPEPFQTKLQHRLKLKEKREDASFDDERRRLAAHLDASDDYLDDLDSLLRWANSVAAEALQNETDYYDPEGSVREPLTALPQHLSNLRRLSVRHPTHEVRGMARALDSKLRGFYGDMTRQSNGEEFPSWSERDELLNFIEQVEELIESIHDPERDPTHSESD